MQIVWSGPSLSSSYVQHTSIEYSSSSLDCILRLLVSWIGFVQLWNEVADEAPSSGPCCLHNHVEA